MAVRYHLLGFIVTALLLITSPGPLSAQVPLPWADDFESYADATLLHGVNGWLGWNNNPALAASTTTSPPPPASSALPILGPNDATVYFTAATTGQWLVQMRQFIPSSFSGTTYVIMLNQYDNACATCNWSVQVEFQSGTGLMVDDGTSGATAAFVTDQWVNIAIEIDLDADTQRFVYNGTQLYSGGWAGYVSGGGSSQIQALDLFANNATVVYYDDISITQGTLPVELTSFDALADGDDVALTWATASETNNAGFSVEQEVTEGLFQEIGYVDGFGTTDEPKDYRFDVYDLDPGIHRFRLKQIDFDGAFEYSGIVEAAVTVPDQFVIEPAYPNPFNPSTRLRFAVAAEQFVNVSLVNVMGQPIQTLYSRTAPANEMQELMVDASDLPSGTYLVHFQGNGLSATERIILTK